MGHLAKVWLFTTEIDNGTIESNTLTRTARRGFSSHLLWKNFEKHFEKHFQKYFWKLSTLL